MVPLISFLWRPTLPSAPCSSEVSGPEARRHYVCGWGNMSAKCLFKNLLTELVSLGTPGRGSSPSSSVYSSSNTVTCHRTHTVPCAHQKPITALRAAAGRLVTGSQDHTLRVCIVYLWILVSWKGEEEEEEEEGPSYRSLRAMVESIPS